MKRIRLERAGAVGTITLARPEKKNALDRVAADEIQSALRDLGADASIRVVVLRADGPDFCAGADLQALEEMLDATEDENLRDAHALGGVFTELRSIAQPVIAVVRGRALAGGAGLATACDIVIAHEDAQFGYPEVRVGFVPAMVMTMLRRCAGEKRAFELVSTGRTVGAREALEIGLVSRVVAGHEFDAAVHELVEKVAGMPPSAQRLTKKLFYALDSRGFSEGVALGVAANVAARSTEEFREGVRRFIARQADHRTP
ncbi:MAG: enoyl-CoA hydratase/isomerase family protein [Gemmatimonadaceae bacterium]